MSGFETHCAYLDFADALKRGQTVHDNNVQNFLDSVRKVTSSRVKTVPRGSTYWRAQLGCGSKPVRILEYSTEEPKPYPKDRMKPLRGKAKGGRANRTGIPYLYMADSKETALSEVRPGKGSNITLAKLITCRELNLVDLISKNRKDIPPIGVLKYFEYFSNMSDEDGIICSLDDAFSCPVSIDDNSPDYIPTQTISDYIKFFGNDGIIYKSSLGTGNNIVLFDLDATEIESTYLHKCTQVRYDFDPEPRQ